MNYSKKKNPFFEIDYSDRVVFYEKDAQFELDSTFRYVNLSNKTLSDSICSTYNLKSLPCVLFYGEIIYFDDDYQKKLSEIESNKEEILKERVRNIISSGEIVLFMKGSIEAPYCRFSKRLVEILRTLNINLDKVIYYDVLMNEEMREQIKSVNQWPTFPQLFIKGEFVGGHDIVCELFETGQLSDLLKN